jgi:hypothetical protein
MVAHKREQSLARQLWHGAPHPKIDSLFNMIGFWRPHLSPSAIPVITPGTYGMFGLLPIVCDVKLC